MGGRPNARRQLAPARPQAERSNVQRSSNCIRSSASIDASSISYALAALGPRPRRCNSMKHITFPQFTGLRCLMMPYIQGDSGSVPEAYRPYAQILDSVFHKKGDIGHLTIDESITQPGQPHRGARAKYPRALHTEAGRSIDVFSWGSTTRWGDNVNVTLDREARVLLANSIDDTCAIWNTIHEDTTNDGDIGHMAHLYPYENAILMKAGDIHNIGILTPHESLPIQQPTRRQFLRIVSNHVHGTAPYFTTNPLLK